MDYRGKLRSGMAAGSGRGAQAAGAGLPRAAAHGSHAQRAAPTAAAQAALARAAEPGRSWVRGLLEGLKGQPALSTADGTEAGVVRSYALDLREVRKEQRESVAVTAVDYLHQHTRADGGVGVPLGDKADWAVERMPVDPRSDAAEAQLHTLAASTGAVAVTLGDGATFTVPLLEVPTTAPGYSRVDLVGRMVAQLHRKGAAARVLEAAGWINAPVVAEYHASTRRGSTAVLSTRTIHASLCFAIFTVGGVKRQ